MSVNAPTEVKFSGSFNISDMGTFIDRWSGVFPRMAEQCSQVQDHFLTELKARKIPNTYPKAVNAQLGLLGQVTSMVGGGYERPYIICETNPGVTCAAYIGQRGTDLYASWRTHVR